MPTRQINLDGGVGGAALAVRVTPRASRNEISGVQPDGLVKIKLTAPPVDGQANEALVAFLAEVLDLPKSKIEIVGGATARNKLVAITGLNAAQVQEIILRRLKT